MTLRVRFAPSPTGELHVGGARTALFNWLLARREEGSFLLRIEDTDRDRSSEGHVRGILEGLSWLGLSWDGDPVFQSRGVERHRRDAHRLLEEGMAYRDYSEPGDPPSEEGDPEDPFAIRFRVPEGVTEWVDLVHGRVRFENSDLEDLVLLRRDGTPTYNLAVVSDDAHMEITHVIRGDDHISNTPKQILLYRALGRPEPRFGHVPLILAPDGTRLSKRHGASSVKRYEEEGILPWAMVNFLALLGWSPGDDQEVMAPSELIRRFSMDRVVKKGAAFDREKLEWLNGEHLRRAPADRIVPLLRPHLLRREGVTEERLEGKEEWLAELVEVLKSRARTLVELAEATEIYLTEEVDFEAEAVEKHWSGNPGEVAERLEALRVRLGQTEWELEPLERELRALAAEGGVGAGTLIHPLRVAVTGRAASPGIFQVLRFVGRNRTLERLERAVSLLRSGDGVDLAASTREEDRKDPDRSGFS